MVPPTGIGAHLCERFGFDRACGPRLEVAAELGLERNRCAAVGDGRSDIPLFTEVGLAVAFNATPAARSAAHTSVDGSDLRAVLPILDAWCRPGGSVSA